MKRHITIIIGFTLILTVLLVSNAKLVTANSHQPFVILSNNDFANYSISGNGSFSNPWIIENLSISSSIFVNENGGRGRYSIFIQDTSDYFIIRNSHIYNPRALFGIYTFNVSNGIIENNIVEINCTVGIGFMSSSNIYIMNNTIKNHRDTGISLYSSSEIVISNNTFMSNQYTDIYSMGNTNVTLTGNDFETGISIDGGDPYIPGDEVENGEETPGFGFVLIILATIISIVILKKRK